jgi:hypothetical protein
MAALISIQLLKNCFYLTKIGMMSDGNKKSLAMKQFGKSITVFLAMLRRGSYEK